MKIESLQSIENQNLASINLSNLPKPGYNYIDHFDENNYASNLTYQQKLNAIKDFNIDFIPSLDLSTDDSILTRIHLENFKSWVDPDTMYARAYVQPIYGSVMPIDYLDTLLALGHIDNFEHTVFNTLLDIAEQNKIGNIGVDSLEIRINELINGWKEQEYKDCDGFGKLSAIVLVISKSSVSWWKENPEASSIERVLPAWVAADISGAILGTISGIIAVSAWSENPFSWDSVGKIGLAAGLGALSGSTGILGKLSKFLFG